MPTVDTCETGDACLVPNLTGSADTCDARCEKPTKITACKSGDGCCAAGCTYEDDDDCSSSCGDGSVDRAKGETCEGQSCPSSCPPANGCTTHTLTGSAAACNAKCVEAITKSPVNGDQCCPSGANAVNDSDCKPRCGNGIKEGAETCDGADCPSCDDGNVCTEDSQTGNAGTCDIVCTHTPRGVNHSAKDSCCPPGATAATDLDCAGCGNKQLEPNEQCDDGNVLNGDLCDAKCALEDDRNTPGDDRPGYVSCGANLSCPANVGCSIPYDAATTTFGTPLCGLIEKVFLSWKCDGPEECPSGTVCALPTNKDVVAVCTAPTNLGFICHTSAQCRPGEFCKGSDQGIGACTKP